MPWFEVKARVALRCEVTVHQSIEAATPEEAQRIAGERAPALAKWPEHPASHSPSASLVSVARAATSDFVAYPPDAALMETGHWRPTEPPGMTDGSIVLFTKLARNASVEELARGHATPVQLNALAKPVRAYEDGVLPVRRHRGCFAQWVLDLCSQLGCFLLEGEAEPTRPALLIDASSRACVGIVMPLKDGESNAPPVPDAWVKATSPNLAELLRVT